MNPILNQLLACPRDGGFPLHLVAEARSNGDITPGTLTCPRCGRSYPIVDGIPDLCDLAGDAESVSLKETEIVVREREADGSYDRLFNRYEIAAERIPVLRSLRLEPHHLVLELGCGNGRMSLAVLERCRELIAVDFSMGFLRALRSKAGDEPRLHLIRADVNRIPLRREPVFDRVVSTQLLEHLPTERLRRAFIETCRSMLKEDGRFVVSAYNYAGVKRRSGFPKEGRHSSGIYYYCYDSTELFDQLSRWFEVQELFGVRNRLGSHRILERLGAAGLVADRAISSTSFSRRTGHLLVAACVPRSGVAGTEVPGPSFEPAGRTSG